MTRVTERVNPQKYGRLLSKALPTVIKTEEENDRAISLVETLVGKGSKISIEENALLDLLWGLIADFEEKFYQPREAAPKEVLLELMNARGLKQTDLAEVLGSKSRVSEVLSGKRELSKVQIRSLAEYFNVSVGLFI